jgi:anti-sigma B factor antagonist
VNSGEASKCPGGCQDKALICKGNIGSLRPHPVIYAGPEGERVLEHSKIKVRFVDKAVILDVEGPVRLGESEQALREKVQELVEAGHRNIAVNLAMITLLDSSGIGSLVRSFTTISRGGGKFVLFAPTKMIRQTLKMVRLDTVLPLHDDEAAALAAI